MTDMKETEDTKEEVFPTHEEIEKLAYALYLTHRAAGREDSDIAALDDWLIAEQQLLDERRIGCLLSPLKSETVARKQGKRLVLHTVRTR